MKRDRHLRKNIISTDSKLQPEVEKVYNEYKGKYLGLDEVLKCFIKLSYYLPDIYNIKVRYKYFIPDITFQSYRTEGFVYRLSGYIYDESYGNSKDKELNRKIKEYDQKIAKTTNSDEVKKIVLEMLTLYKDNETTLTQIIS